MFQNGFLKYTKTRENGGGQKDGKELSLNSEDCTYFV